MTEFKIEVNLAHVPEGTPVELYGLGTYLNGGTYDVPDELVQLHRINNPVYDVNENDEKINVDVMDTLNPQEGIKIFRTESETAVDSVDIKTFNDLAQALESDQVGKLAAESDQSDPVDPLEPSGSENAPTDAEEGTK
jgi:hypothetical protein